MYQIIIRQQATDDMVSACDWYDAQRPGLGDELLNKANKTLLKLSWHPQYYSYFNTCYRRIKLKRFPYYFLYEVRSNVVIVFQFYHAKQNRR